MKEKKEKKSLVDLKILDSSLKRSTRLKEMLTFLPKLTYSTNNNVIPKYDVTFMSELKLSP
jgi:hypothetical protein